MRLTATLFIALCCTGAIASASDAPAPASTAAPDADLAPLDTKAPEFPRGALVKGISGWVVVRGTVAPDGTVAAVRVVRSSPPGVFDASALRAVKQWRYRPRIVDGVAVAREFEQRIDFQLGDGAPAEPYSEALVRAVKAEPEQVRALYGALRALCPDAYRRAADAPNLALQAVATPAEGAPREAPAEPYALILQTNAVQRCLFSSWEQFADPAAWAAAERWAPFELKLAAPARKLKASLAALGAVQVGGVKRGADGATADDLLPARAWIFGRIAPAYAALTQAHAQALTPAPPLGATARAAIEQARALEGQADPRGARRALRQALDGTLPGTDRAQLLLALARLRTMENELNAARADVEAAIALEGVPWNLVMAGETARLHLCARLEDAACFDAALGRLHRELAVADRLAF